MDKQENPNNRQAGKEEQTPASKATKVCGQPVSPFETDDPIAGLRADRNRFLSQRNEALETLRNVLAATEIWAAGQESAAKALEYIGTVAARAIGTIERNNGR